MHPASRVSNGIKRIDEPVRRRLAKLLIRALELRDKCSANGIHAALIHRILDRPEVEVNAPGVALQLHAVSRRNKLGNVLFLNRLIRTMARLVCCAGGAIVVSSPKFIKDSSHCLSRRCQNLPKLRLCCGT